MIRCTIEIEGVPIGVLKLSGDLKEGSSVDFDAELTYFEDGAWQSREFYIESFQTARGPFALVATALAGTRHVRTKEGRNDPGSEDEARR